LLWCVDDCNVDTHANISFNFYFLFNFIFWYFIFYFYFSTSIFLFDNFILLNFCTVSTTAMSTLMPIFCTHVLWQYSCHVISLSAGYCTQPVQGVISVQCNTNINYWTEYEYECIRNVKFHRIQISNIFVSNKLVEYEYRIYSFLANFRIRISNIFVLSKLDEYEYRIYSFLANLSNTNIEYIRNQKIKYSYSNI